MYRLAILAVLMGTVPGYGQGQPAESLARQLEETQQQLLRQKAEVARLQGLLEATGYQQRLDQARREWFDGNIPRAQVLLDECQEGLRGFEWRFLDQLLRGARVTGYPAGEPGMALTFRPGDDEVLLITTRGTGYSWDVSAGQEKLVGVMPRRLTAPVSSIRRAARSHDGKFAAVASDGPEVAVIDLREGKRMRTIPALDDSVTDLAFSGNGRRLGILARNKLRVWDLEEDREVYSVSILRRGAVCLDLGPAGDTVAIGHVDGVVRVWDLEAGLPLLALAHPAVPSRVRFHPEGDRLAVLAGDRMSLWKLTEAPPHSLELAGNPTGVTCFAWSPDGSRLAAGSGALILTWDSAGQELLETHRGHTDRVRLLSFGAEGRRLASMAEDGILKVWDVPGHPAGVLYRGHARGISAVAWSPDSRYLATAGLDRIVKVWEVPTQRVMTVLGLHPGPVTGLAYSPDGKQIATGCEDGVVRTWEAATGKPVENLAGFKARISAVAYSPDGKYLAAVSQDGVLQMLAREDGKARGVKLPGAGLFGLAFRPDGGQLAVSCSDLSDVAIRLFEPGTLRELELLKGPRANPAIAWSPDGKALAFASSTGTRILGRVPGNPSELVLRDLAGAFDLAGSLAYSPDGRRLATAGVGRPVRVWDTATGLELIASPESISGGTLAFSPDGTRLALGESTGLVRVFEGPPRSLPRSYLDSNYHLAFSPDGKWMLTGLRQPEHLLQVRDLERQRKGPILDTLGGGLLSQRIVFAPDSASVRTLQEQRDAAGKSKFLVRFWDIRTGKELGRNVIEPTDPVSQWQWNGSRLAAALATEAGKPVRIAIWDAVTGKLTRTLDNVGSRISSLALSPEGTRLVITALTGTREQFTSSTAVWDPDTGKVVQTQLEPKEAGLVLSRFVFGPGGRSLACFATGPKDVNEVILFDPNEGRIRKRVAVSQAQASLTFTPDGEQILLTTGGAILQIPIGQGVETRLPAAPYLPFQVDQLVFTPDGKRLAVQGGLHRTSRVYLWDYPPPQAPDVAEIKKLEPVRAHIRHRTAATAALNERSWYAAVYHLDRLLIQLPEAGELYRQRGRALVGLEQYERAVPDLERALRGNVTGVGNGITASDWKALQPVIEGALIKAADSWPLHALHGHALSAQKKWPEAVQAFARAVKLGGSQVIVLDRYAFAALAAEDQLLYRKNCQAMLAAFAEPKDATTANNIAWAALLGRNEGKVEQPLNLAKRAVEAAAFAPAETRHAYLNTLALAYYRSNKLEEADRMVRAAIEANDNIPSRLDHLLLALIQGQLGKKEAARMHLAQGLQGRENDPALLGSWEARLEVELLRVEAELVIGK